MRTIEVERGWYKIGYDAMTYKQYAYIMNLSTEDNLEGFEFPSTTNAMRNIDKFTASMIIDELKAGNKVVIK